jgi:TolB protein
MDANGDNQGPLTEDGGFYDDPAWSPLDDVIAVTRAAADGGTKSIWLVPVGGGAPKRLTHVDLGESDPTWSPDGKALAFSRDGNLVVVDLEGKVLAEVPLSVRPIGWPEWH